MDIEQVLVNPVFLAVLSLFLWRAIMIENPIVKLVFQAIGTVITLLLGLLFNGAYKLLLKQCNDPTYEWCSIWAASISTGGFIIAAIVFLFGLYVLWKMLRRKHGLDIFYNNDDEWCRHFNEKSIDGKDAYFTRLKIINNSNAIVNCYGDLRIIKDKDGSGRNSHWDKSSLGWYQQTNDEVGEPVAIKPNGDHRYLDVVWVNKDEDIFKIRTSKTPQRVITRRSRGQYYFYIVISSDKLGTIKQWFMARWRGDYADFKMKKVWRIEITVPFLRHRLDRYQFPPSPPHA